MSSLLVSGVFPTIISSSAYYSQEFLRFLSFQVLLYLRSLFPFFLQGIDFFLQSSTFSYLVSQFSIIITGFLSSFQFVISFLIILLLLFNQSLFILGQDISSVSYNSSSRSSFFPNFYLAFPMSVYYISIQVSQVIKGSSLRMFKQFVLKLF